LNLSARPSRSVEGGKLEGGVQRGHFLFKLFLDGFVLFQNLIMKYVPECPAADGPGSHVEEIENSQANQNPGPPVEGGCYKIL
jgi:hypothetical protein